MRAWLAITSATSAIAWLKWAVLASALVIAAGCHQRQPENPFQEPYGASTNSPYGG
jgi:hypothetical protein